MIIYYHHPVAFLQGRLTAIVHQFALSFVFTVHLAKMNSFHLLNMSANLFIVILLIFHSTFPTRMIFFFVLHLLVRLKYLIIVCPNKEKIDTCRHNTWMNIKNNKHNGQKKKKQVQKNFY